MPTGSQLVAELPPNGQALGPDGIPERDRMILDMLGAGYSPPYDWTQLVSATDRGMMRLLVGADAVKVGDESDAVRVNLSQLAAQELADRHDCALLTPKLNDLVWEQSAVKPPPMTIDPYPDSQTWAMVEHSRRLDEALPLGMPPSMLVANVGKGAVNSTLLWRPEPRPAKMAIYGWHVPSGHEPAATPDGGRVIQAESIRHVAYFVDYSATVRFVRREVEFTDDSGSRVLDLAAVAADPELCQYVSHAGPVVMRHPGIPCPPAVSLVGGGGKLPCGCPPPSGAIGPSPTPSPAAGGVSNTALVIGGVLFASAIAYFATR
jgi:hypothetical protein